MQEVIPTARRESREKDIVEGGRLTNPYKTSEQQRGLVIEKSQLQRFDVWSNEVIGPFKQQHRYEIPVQVEIYAIDVGKKARPSD